MAGRIVCNDATEANHTIIGRSQASCLGGSGLLRGLYYPGTRRLVCCPDESSPVSVLLPHIAKMTQHGPNCNWGVSETSPVVGVTLLARGAPRAEKSGGAHQPAREILLREGRTSISLSNFDEHWTLAEASAPSRWRRDAVPLLFRTLCTESTCRARVPDISHGLVAQAHPVGGPARPRSPTERVVGPSLSIVFLARTEVLGSRCLRWHSTWRKPPLALAKRLICPGAESHGAPTVTELRHRGRTRSRVGREEGRSRRGSPQRFATRFPIQRAVSNSAQCHPDMAGPQDRRRSGAVTDAASNAKTQSSVSTYVGSEVREGRRGMDIRVHRARMAAPEPLRADRFRVRRGVHIP